MIIKKPKKAKLKKAESLMNGENAEANGMELNNDSQSNSPQAPSSSSKKKKTKT